MKLQTELFWMAIEHMTTDKLKSQGLIYRRGRAGLLDLFIKYWAVGNLSLQSLSPMNFDMVSVFIPVCGKT